MAVYVRPLSQEEMDKIHSLIEMEKEEAIKKRLRIILLSHHGYRSTEIHPKVDPSQDGCEMDSHL